MTESNSKTLSRTRVDGGKRCRQPGCRGWSTKDASGLCVAHSPAAQASAKAAMQERKKQLRFPPLDSTQNAREWLRVIGLGLTTSQLKPSRAREMRLLASAYLSSDQGGALSDRIDEVEERMAASEEEAEKEEN